MLRTLALVLLLGCGPEENVSKPVVPGQPIAGAAEGTIDLPVGTPMGGFSGRAVYLGADGRPDNRDSAYSTGFVESAGIQTRPTIKVLWLGNGDRHLVLVKVDLIYSYDNLVVAVTERLEELTGESLRGQVFIAANHSHNAYGPFSDQYHFYLGGDRYNEEIFQRLTQVITDTSFEAYETREPAAIGTSWTKDWDPTDAVYRDRRGDNDELVLWEDTPNANGKDPWLHLIRVDDLDGNPIAVTFTYGIHGTSMGADSPMLSSDSPGHVELVVQESFPEDTVIMHLQGGAGDASPGGTDRGYARMETVGHYARDAIYNAWETTPTSSEPFSIESQARHIWQTQNDIHVSRNGAVDWYYPDTSDITPPDDIIYDADGHIITPLDEFNAPYGAAFCGSEDPLIPTGNIGSEVFPYVACMDVELVSALLEGIFELEVDSIPLPLPESKKAGTAAALLGPLPTRQTDGTTAQEDLLIGFFPGEATAMFTEQWRRRVQQELGLPRPVMVGYAQDHEGYLMITEDWLLGGYEPNINIWGPLQAEHIMEGVLDYSQLLGNERHDKSDPVGIFQPTQYPDRPLPTLQPDRTPDAGTLLTSDDALDLYLPREMTLDLQTPTQIKRIEGVVQVAWRGGDAMVDLPTVTLEHYQDGAWRPVMTEANRPVNDALQDILVTHTPDPLYPVDVEQTHTWWATWQAVGHVNHRTALPVGQYRFAIDGEHWVGNETVWPWTTESYRIETPPWEVLPASISLERTETGLSAWFQAPSEGYRLVDLEGNSQGSNPLRGQLNIQWGDESGTEESTELVSGSPAGNRTALTLDLSSATWVSVTDAFGNTGRLDW